jgi:anthranilate phosphoribosyltransferase
MTTDPRWVELHSHLLGGADLTPTLATFVMGEILEGRASDESITEFLVDIKNKGESAQDITLLIEQMYKYSLPISVPDRAVDIVGTGGDGYNTINISTTAAMVITGAGARVLKHGSRAASSKSGSADVLDALGINTTLMGPEVEQCVRRIGIGFCLATVFHSSLRHAAPARKALGMPSIFNILGPLANPAKPQVTSLGVANKSALPMMAKVLMDRGGEGFAFRSEDGMDELSLSSPTTVISFGNGEMSSSLFDPRDINIEPAPIEALVGGDAPHNAAIVENILQGAKGPHREAVLLNAAIGIAAFKGDSELGVTQQIANGYVAATQAIDSGKAWQVLQDWRAVTNELASARPA